ncbi:CMRF35-like molecule 9 isoform X5 [Cavia porcellus]|uniref:CMRF35-like molecule 9 isoform X5 n=1 Tax=Cavia porcellus TaxID=10141 RepID=UPI002FE4213C
MRALVLLWGCLALRASATLSCPKELSGSEGETVTLRCTYGEEQRTRTKYWCREGGLFISRCSDKIIVGEDSREATKNRVSFRDSPSELAFTVTLRDLMLKDSGKYWCGAQKLGREEWFEVSLTVFPTCPSPRSACWPRSWCSCPSCWPWASSPWVPTCSGLGSQGPATGAAAWPHLRPPGFLSALLAVEMQRGEKVLLTVSLPDLCQKGQGWIHLIPGEGRVCTRQPRARSPQGKWGKEEKGS